MHSKKAERRRPSSMKPIHVNPYCSRCGTCCRQGGPSLHAEDRTLVEQGFIHTRHLYTIRRGERVHDPIRGELVRADGDIIKIKGGGGSWACRFLDGESNRCRIYPHRPLECRALECWNTSRIEQVYDRSRLSRRELLAGMDGLWELIEDHERRCGYDRIRDWLEGAAGSDAEKNRRQVAEAAAYDGELRRLMVSRGRLEAGILDFLLGRPVDRVLRISHRADGPPLHPSLSNR